MAQYSGFPQESFDTVFIILDKMDKIGLEGVAEELRKKDLPKKVLTLILDFSKKSLLISKVFATVKRN